MWENESDGSKLYRCRWFFRPSQAFKVRRVGHNQAFVMKLNVLLKSPFSSIISLWPCPHD
jgi:hypothetical protein